MTLKKINKHCCLIVDKLSRCGLKNNCDKKYSPLSSKCSMGKMRICKIHGDRELCARMAALGIYPGEKVEIICPQQGRNCLLKIHGGTVSLDSNISNNIMVEPL